MNCNLHTRFLRPAVGWAMAALIPLALHAAQAPAPAAGTPTADDIRDIHGPILLTFWEQHGTEIFLAALGLFVVASLLGWWLLRKTPVPPLTPIEIARRALQAAAALAAPGDSEVFAIKVSDAVRRYLEDAYQMPAPERTTEEFLQEAARHEWLKGELTGLLRRFLELCDLAKFAGVQFGEAERGQLVAAAGEFLETAENLLHPPPVKVAPGETGPLPSDEAQARLTAVKKAAHDLSATPRR